MGAVMPVSRSAPTKVVVFQWPWGTLMRSLWPRGARPYRRAMLVEAQVSSIKTRRSGSRSSCPSNQSWRRFKMSGRSCSLACAVFFARDLVAIEKPPERSIAHQDPFLGELLAEFLERQVWRGLKRREDCRRVRFRPGRAVVAANRLWRGVPLRPLKRSHRLTLGALTPKRRPALRPETPSAI